MRVRAIEAVLLAGLLCCATGVSTATAQGPLTGSEAGIWIANGQGEMQRVQPSAASFLRQDAAGDAELVLSVETFATSATGAIAAGNLAVTRVLHAVAASGVPGNGVSYELAYVEPRYRHRILAASWEKPRQLGFDAAHVITIRSANPATLGRVIDSAIGAGATRVLSVDADAGR